MELDEASYQTIEKKEPGPKVLKLPKTTVKIITPETSLNRLVVQTYKIEEKEQIKVKYFCACHRKIGFIIEGEKPHHSPSFVDSDQESVLSIASIRTVETPKKAQNTDTEVIDLVTPVKITRRPFAKRRCPIEFVDCNTFVSPKRPSCQLDSLC